MIQKILLPLFGLTLISFVAIIGEFETTSLVKPNWTILKGSKSTNHANDAYNGNERYSWRPSYEWIDQCVQDVQNDTSIVRPFEPGVYKDYTLSDCVKLCRNCYREIPKVKDPSMIYPTFAVQYGRVSCPRQQWKKYVRGNLTLVEHIMEEAAMNHRKKYSRIPPGIFETPQDDEIVIHLRLGDVIDHETRKDPVQTMLFRGTSPWHDVYFNNSIKSISEYLDTLEHETNRKKVSIRGGSHFKYFYKKSRVYGECLKRAIEFAGYTVTQYELDSNNPDNDFYYMSHASTFIATAGGFSKMIGLLVARGGGKVIGRQWI